jgi:hypothetical protein
MAKPTGNYIRVTIHVADGEAVMGEIDSLPGPSDMFVRLRNPRRRDNKPATWLSQDVHTVVFSAAHITYIEVHDDTQAIGWVIP